MPESPKLARLRSPRLKSFDRFTAVVFAIVLLLTIVVVFWIGLAKVVTILAEAF